MSDWWSSMLKWSTMRQDCIWQVSKMHWIWWGSVPGRSNYDRTLSWPIYATWQDSKHFKIEMMISPVFHGQNSEFSSDSLTAISSCSTCHWRIYTTHCQSLLTNYKEYFFIIQWEFWNLFYFPFCFVFQTALSLLASREFRVFSMVFHVLFYIQDLWIITYKTDQALYESM